MSETATGRASDERLREERIAAAAAEIASHRRLLRSGRDGRMLSALMLPMVRITAPRGFGVLTTTGRKTGKSRSKCVRVIRRGDSAYLVALRLPHIAVTQPDAVQAWVWNIRAHPNVRLQLEGATVEAVAREITDPAELDKARSAICDTVVPMDYGECVLHLRGLPSRSKIQELHRYWFVTGIPLAIDLGRQS
jgi:deazaflavin-dependent oxidoreductase (nitroreductase family)